MSRLLHRTLSRSLIALACAATLSGAAWAQTATPATRILHAPPGQTLTLPSQAAPAAIIAGALRARGGADLDGQLDVQGDGAGLGGLRHVRLQQQVGGVPVHGATIKATLSARGELLHVIDRSVDARTAAPQAARIDERQALQAALARVHPGVAAGIGAAARDGLTTRFAASAYFHNAPAVSKVLLPQAGGSLAEGFLVQTWTQRQNLLDHAVVDGSGHVVSVERRTANDSYNVFLDHPGAGPQTVVNGPGAGNAESPAGWLSGTQTTYTINGNNVSAYLDADNNNRADKGGTAVSTGNFLTAANLTASPTTTGNKAVAVQNLFYLNNRIHDILYRHGFNEAAGNFQTNNFNKGGRGRDPVNAEAQDGSGTDNANFATPADGQRPRMQMYLFTGAAPTHEVIFGTTTNFGAVGSSFGAQLTTTGITYPVVAASNDGCTAMTTAVSGKIALVDRGNCEFVIKVKSAQLAGALGVLIANNAAGRIFAPGGTDSTVTIPSAMISQADGAALRATLLGQTGTMRKKAVQPLQIDASLDSDIVYHEYGHGLSWRMIGSISGPISGAIGEGASDVLAFMVNGRAAIGAYATSDPAGIRRQPYDSFTRTYADVTGGSVHNDGEIYAAAMWKLRTAWTTTAGRPNDTLFGHFVNAMNYIPAGPTYEQMRNGLLDSMKLSTATPDTAGCALVWQAFAALGIGDGSKAVINANQSVTTTPSNTARADCSY